MMIGEWLWRTDDASRAAVHALGDHLSAPNRSELVGNLDADVQRAWELFGKSPESVPVTLRDLTQVFFEGGPRLVVLAPNELGVLAIRGVRRGTVTLVTPSGDVITVRRRDLCERIVQAFLGRSGIEIPEAILASLPAHKRADAPDRLRRHLLASATVARVYCPVIHAASSLEVLTTALNVPRRAAILTLLVFASSGAIAASWALLTRGATSGISSPRVLWGWLVFQITSVVILTLLTWFSSVFAQRMASVVRRRLFEGALQRDLDTLRSQGAGSVTSLVFTAAGIETGLTQIFLQAGPGFTSLLSTAALIAISPRPWPLAIAFLVMVTATVVMAVRSYRPHFDWESDLNRLTRLLSDNMLGHRTRVTQQAPGDWHTDEAALLERYRATSKLADTRAELVQIMPRLWMPIALLGLVPTILDRPSVSAMALPVVAALTGREAIRSLATTLKTLVHIAASAKQISTFARIVPPEPEPIPTVPERIEGAVAEVSGASVVYGGRKEASLKNVSLTIFPRDRILVEGPSGSGKSTFTAVLAGIRRPSRGLVAVAGHESGTTSSRGWSRIVASAPQFHDNHIFTSSLLFNLLLGRRWPPREGDEELAESVCRELGLGPLLDRMPTGIHTQVGESGWALSHGERGRVFLARVLLQGSPLLIFDETLSALDPETLDVCVRAIQRAEQAVVLVAHP